MLYIGLDIGDGETAVSVLTEESAIDPVVQTLGGVKSLLSVVGMKGDEIIVGERALTTPGITYLRARFKSRFLTSPSAGDELSRFARGLDALITQSTHAREGAYRICVGCPAGWNAMDRQRYAGILRAAGFAYLDTVSEARAAFLYAKYAHDLLVDARLLEGNALVVDIGSSTTDIAYIAAGRETDVGSGAFGHINLGGGLIEATLLKMAVDESPHQAAILSIFEREPTWKHHCEIAARRLKETYYADEDAWAERPCVSTVMIYYDEPIALSLSMDAAVADAIIKAPLAELGGASFRSALDDSLQRAVLSTQDAPPQLVMLTGGASQMRFFQEACQAAFPEAAVALSAEPAFSTAKGLAYAARIDARLARFQAEVSAYFEAGRIQRYVTGSLDALVQSLAPPLTDFITAQAVIPAIRTWRSAKVGTLNDLESALSGRIRDLLRSPQAMDEIRPAITAWSQSLVALVQADLDAICARNHIDKRQMALLRLHADADIGGIRIALPGKGVSVVITLVSAVVMASLAGGEALALVATGPVGLIVGAVIGALVALLSLAFGEQVYRSVNIPPWLRKALPMWAFERTLRGEGQRRSIEDALEKALGDPDGAFARQIAGDIARDLKEQISQLARQVSLPVY